MADSRGMTDRARNGKPHPLVSFVPPALVNAKSMGMVAEQRVWLCVLLRGIAETDVANVTGIGGTVEKRNRKRDALRASAVSWMASDDFEVVCQNAGVDVRYARLLSPAKAEQAYQAIVSGKIETLLESIVGQDDTETGDDSADRCAGSD